MFYPVRPVHPSWLKIQITLLPYKSSQAHCQPIKPYIYEGNRRLARHSPRDKAKNAKACKRDNIRYQIIQCNTMQYHKVFCHICCHICIIFVILFYATSKGSMWHEIFFYTILIHPRGQLWAELLQMLRTFSGQKWLFLGKNSHFLAQILI